MASEWPPNGLPFSRRKRATKTCQNAYDLGREAVGWNGVFGGGSQVHAFLIAYTHPTGRELLHICGLDE